MLIVSMYVTGSIVLETITIEKISYILRDYLPLL